MAGIPPAAQPNSAAPSKLASVRLNVKTCSRELAMQRETAERQKWLLWGFFKSFLLNMLYFLNLQGPKGAKGDPGSMGAMGQKGETGEMGSAGPPVGPFGVPVPLPSVLYCTHFCKCSEWGWVDFSSDLSTPPYCGEF